MKNDENIAQRIEHALNSIDGLKRATPKAFLFTRIQARLDNIIKSRWENTALFISRPLVMALGLCLIITVNISVIIMKNSSKDALTERSVTSVLDEDEYYTTFATTDTIETP